jgi:hypothetical protein
MRYMKAVKKEEIKPPMKDKNVEIKTEPTAKQPGIPKTEQQRSHPSSPTTQPQPNPARK